MKKQANTRTAGLGFILRLSWRNIWRNRGRSLSLMTAIFLGLVGGTFAMAMITGFMGQRFYNAIEKQYSHLQLHSKTWLDEGQAGMMLPNGPALLDSLRQLPQVKLLSARSLAQGLVASPTLTQGAEVRGVDPEAENQLVALSQQLIAGHYFSDSAENQLLLGAKLAKKLKLEVGSRLVLSFPNAEQEIVSAAFRVQGLFRTANAGFDQSTVYVQKHQLDALLGENAPVYELAIRLHELDSVQGFTGQLQAAYPQLSIRSWRELAPELAYMQDSGSVVSYIFVFIILLGLSFGILNSMLMAVYERMREIGMLKALGMTKSRIFIMIMVETLCMSLLAALAGLGAGGVLVAITSRTGINLGAYADALAEFGYDAELYPELSASYALNITLLVIVLSLLAALYPALKALKLNAADAIRS
jgi:ABC-type lipoprotein release transport system permease subunit